MQSGWINLWGKMLNDIDSVNHVGLAVHDLDATASFYEDLGFILTPLSMHKGSMNPGEPEIPYGTGNRCAIFPSNYLEIVAHVDKDKYDFGMIEYLSRFEGAHIICFGCGNAEIVHDRVTKEGFTTSGVIPLERKVDTPEGERTAKFDCVHFPRDATPEGLIQAAHHRTPEYIHQDRYLGHPNGVVALSEVFLCVEDPDEFEARYVKLTGRKADRVGVKRVIAFPLVSKVSIVAADDIQNLLPNVEPPDLPYIAGYSMATERLDSMRERLVERGIQFDENDGTLIVPADAAFGAAIVFEAA